MKDISDQEVVDHLKRLNGWWRDGAVSGEVFSLKSRAYLPAVKSLVMDEKLYRAVVLMGPRRVGKTVLARERHVSEHVGARAHRWGVAASRRRWQILSHT